MTRLHQRLSLALLGVLAALGAGFLMLGLHTSRLYEMEVQQRLNAELADHIVEHYPLIRSRRVNDGALEELFRMLMVINPSIEVYLLDPEGGILAYEAPPGHVERRRVSLGPIEAALRGRGRFPILGDDPRDADGSKAFSVAPIRDGGQLQGYLYVVLGGEAYDTIAGALAGSYALRLGAWLGAAILLLCAGVAALLFRRLTRPLSRLDARMADFAARELDEPIRPEVERDEIDRLQATFDAMSRRIREQIDALQQNDRLRRELVVSVSHDLRTPLAHLQGYLETLRLRGERLDADERQEYLGIALRHAERLGRLVHDLFELAKLDALNAPVQVEDFSVAELVRDVVDKQRLAADRRGIALTAQLASHECRVQADPSLLERALENLVENALRHTPAGGSVQVLGSRAGDLVSIQVRDTGEGIPPEERDRVFDRFYRTPSSSVEDRGSGLGLAIVRRAVELHRGSIRIESAPGGGSVFALLLPAVAANARDDT